MRRNPDAGSALSVGRAGGTVYRHRTAAMNDAMHQALTLPDGRRLALGAMPLIMGIVNMTPDSFSDGGILADAGEAVAHGLRLIAEGAAIVDIGGESTRPGHALVDAATELSRVLPVIAGLQAQSDVPLSIDSWKSEVAAQALAAGASIVNDVWGAQRDPAIAGVAARHGAPMVLMHNRDGIDPAIDILSDVLTFLERSIALATAAGLPRSQIVVDPGIGFGKTPAQNLTLIAQIDRLGELGCPILLGASRKSTIGLVTGQSVAAERVAGSVAAHLFGAAKGAAIIRAHDVAPHKQAFQIWDALAEHAKNPS